MPHSIFGWSYPPGSSGPPDFDGPDLCVVCGKLVDSKDGFSFCCDVCGREGFCRHCSAIGNHDCDEPPFWVEEEPAADRREPETERGEGEGD